MLENPDRALEEVLGRPEASPEDAQEQETEEGGRLRVVSEILAIISAGVLAGGGAGMLGGVALGAINPFFLGIIGVVLGTGASVPLARAVLKRLEEGTGDLPPASPGPGDPRPGLRRGSDGFGGPGDGRIAPAVVAQGVRWLNS